jgi:WD40 repeat protein
MQVVHTLWGDKPDVCVTAVRWSPEGLSRDLSRQSPLRLACGDSAGRVAIWDAARGELVTWLGLDRNGGPIVDLCWGLGRPWQLAVLQAPSSLLILDTTRFVFCTSSHGGYRYGQMQEWYLVLQYENLVGSL